jgi:hypothetical protein
MATEHTLRKLIESCDRMVIEGIEVDSVMFDSTGENSKISQFVMADETRVYFDAEHKADLQDGEASFLAGFYETGKVAYVDQPMTIQFFCQVKLTPDRIQ